MYYIVVMRDAREHTCGCGCAVLNSHLDESFILAASAAEECEALQRFIEKVNTDHLEEWEDEYQYLVFRGDLICVDGESDDHGWLEEGIRWLKSAAKRRSSQDERTLPQSEPHEIAPPRQVLLQLRTVGRTKGQTVAVL